MVLDTDPTIQIVGEAESSREALRQAKRLMPNVVLMDLAMPGGDGIQVIAEITRSCPQAKVLVLTELGDEPNIKAALKAGAQGYLLKDADGNALLQAIRAVQRGDMPLHPQVAKRLIRNAVEVRGVNGKEPLTEREKEVLRLVSTGMTNKAIARALVLTEGTVKVHVSRVLGKLGVSNRTQASMLALHTGLISPPEQASRNSFIFSGENYAGDNFAQNPSRCAT
jgi:DNA-binding NarL/FixJ family response regulator